MQTYFTVGDINLDLLFMTQSWQVENIERKYIVMLN